MKEYRRIHEYYEHDDIMQDKHGPFCYLCHWRGNDEDFDDDGLCPDCHDEKFS